MLYYNHFRTAVETQLMGARTVLVERRPNFTRNNVLKVEVDAVNGKNINGCFVSYGNFSFPISSLLGLRSYTGSLLLE